MKNVFATIENGNITNLYSRETMVKILSGEWTLKLTDNDRVFAHGDAETILNEIERSAGWGTWIATEDKQESDDVFASLFEPRTYTIKLMDIL